MFENKSLSIWVVWVKAGRVISAIKVSCIGFKMNTELDFIGSVWKLLELGGL